LILSKIAKKMFSFFLFLPFYSSYNVPDSGISEKFIQISSTLALVNIV
jgi:hypothetical protein